MKGITFFTLLKMLFIGHLIKIADAADPELILYIMGDDVGPADLGFKLPTATIQKYLAHTPNIDLIRTQSALYPNVFAATVCGPSRASILTGLPLTYSPWRGNSDTIKDHQVPFTLPQALRKINWKPILSGKFGFGDCSTKQSIEYFGFNRSLYYATHVDAHYPFPLSLYNDCKKIIYANNNGASREKCLKGKCTSANDEILSYTIQQIQECIENKERCAIFHMPTFTHIGQYTPSKKGPYPVTDYENYPPSWPRYVKGYASMLTKFDRHIGIIMNTIESLGKRNATLTFIYGDNGAECSYQGSKIECMKLPFGSDGGRKGTKRSMYQGGIVTPVIANWPGTISTSYSSDFPWALHDLALTTLEILHAPSSVVNMFSAPNNIQEGKPISVANMLLKGDAYAPTRPLLFTENCENGEASCTFAVLNTTDWRNKLPKLVCNTPSCVPEFYDVKADPAESKNLANLPDSQQPIAQMLKSRRDNRMTLKA